MLFRDGTPQANARIEVWQANAAGRYAHPGDTRADVPLDTNFEGYADIQTCPEGRFRIRTVRPGSYPVESWFHRSPHIHFDVRGRERRLITQMYFDDTDRSIFEQDLQLKKDLWGRTELPETIFAKLQRPGHYAFDIVL